MFTILVLLVLFGTSYITARRLTSSSGSPGVGTLNRLYLELCPRRRARVWVSAIQRSVSRQSMVGVKGKVLVPNLIRVSFDAEDYEVVAAMMPWFASQVESAVETLLRSPGWTTNGPLAVQLEQGAVSVDGMPTVTASFAAPQHHTGQEVDDPSMTTDRATNIYPTSVTESVSPIACEQVDCSWRLVGPKGEVAIEDAVTIGRSAAADVILDDPRVSGLHARVSLERRLGGSVLWIYDLDSRNGSYVNDERVELQRVTAGDELRFGRSTFLVETDSLLVTERL